MIIAEGYKTRYGYAMRAPEYPYTTTVYYDCTLKQLKHKYRADHNLGHKRIVWIINK